MPGPAGRVSFASVHNTSASFLDHTCLLKFQYLLNLPTHEFFAGTQVLKVTELKSHLNGSMPASSSLWSESYPLCSSQGLCSCNDDFSFFLNFLCSFPSAYEQESIASVLKTKSLGTSSHSMFNFSVLPFIGNSWNNYYDSWSSFPHLSVSLKTCPIKILSPPLQWNGFVQGQSHGSVLWPPPPLTSQEHWEWVVTPPSDILSPWASRTAC